MKKKMNRKRLAAVLLAVFAILVQGGCGKKDTADMNSGNGEIPESLTILCGMGNYTVKAGAKDLNDTAAFRLMEEMTGCHVNWIHPPAGAGDEKLNLLIASGDLPDMMVHNWSSVAGGIEMYVEDEIILPLADLIDKNMPNLSEYNNQHPEVKKQYSYDNGEIYYIPFIRKDAQLKVCEGPQIRMDWLEKLGLEVPTTPDELYNVLKAFKTMDPNGNGKADEIPMSGVSFNKLAHGIGNLLWSFGTTYDFYLKDGNVKYGIMEDEFKEGLAYITKLYAEGLIDPDYLINDRDKMDNKVLNDKVGLVYSYQPTMYYTNMKNTDKVMKGIPHFSQSAGASNVYDKTYSMDATTVSLVVTTANKNPSGSLKWLDNFYGGKGYEYMNFGEEGVSFEWVDGYPKLTDYILNNPDGKTVNEMGGLYLGTMSSNFPALQDWRYYEQTLSEWGKESINTWNESAVISDILPPISFTDEESNKIAQKMSQIETYTSETIDKIVTGNADINEIDKAREKIKDMGIDEVLKIYEAALARYNNR